MEALIHPASLFGGKCCLMGEGNNSMWTKEENKRFERALAIFDESTPDRWHKVAEMIPGKSVWDVIKQYKELEQDVNVIEAGLAPIPAYLWTSSSCFAFEWVDSLTKKSSSSMTARPVEQQERRRGIPWTEEEHRRFLVGLEKHGKGDWRSISRKFVMSKTPTQVASHAQKYFLRQLSVGKDKKRPSIHDITTANLLGVLPSSSQTFRTPYLPNHNEYDTVSLGFDGLKFPAHPNLYSCGRHGASYVV